MRRHALLLLFCIGCSDEPTEVLVIFEADPDLAADAVAMRVRVCDETGRTCGYDRTNLIGDITFPTTVPVSPGPGGPSQRFFVEGTLDGSGGMLSRVSATSGFVEGERTELRLRFTRAPGDGGTMDADRADGGVSDAGVPSDGGEVDGLIPCDCPCSDDACVDGACVPAAPIAQVGAGFGHACGVSEAGELWCWGANNYGQLGQAKYDFTPRTSPSSVPTAAPVAFAEASDEFSMALFSDQTLWTWGRNRWRQLGIGSCCSDATDDQQLPARVGTELWAHAAIGHYHGCAVSFTRPGQLYCWGRNQLGEAGSLAMGQYAAPRRVDFATDWTTVSAGDVHSCAIKNDGRLFCWGGGSSGRTGLGAETSYDSPQRVTAGAATWIQVSAGLAHTCAIGGDRSLWCWGAGANGRLGDGDTRNRLAPSQADAAGALDWTLVASGHVHSCGIRGEGELWCWGNDLNGELGTSAIDTESTLPVAVEGGAGSWRDVSAGQSFTCGVGTDGTLWCWGSATGGRLGLGDGAADTPLPARVCIR